MGMPQNPAPPAVYYPPLLQAALSGSPWEQQQAAAGAPAGTMAHGSSAACMPGTLQRAPDTGGSGPTPSSLQGSAGGTTAAAAGTIMRGRLTGLAFGSQSSGPQSGMAHSSAHMPMHAGGDALAPADAAGSSAGRPTTLRVSSGQVSSKAKKYKKNLQLSQFITPVKG